MLQKAVVDSYPPHSAAEECWRVETSSSNLFILSGSWEFVHNVVWIFRSNKMLTSFKRCYFYWKGLLFGRSALFAQALALLFWACQHAAVSVMVPHAQLHRAANMAVASKSCLFWSTSLVYSFVWVTSSVNVYSFNPWRKLCFLYLVLKIKHWWKWAPRGISEEKTRACPPPSSLHLWFFNEALWSFPRSCCCNTMTL